MLTVEGPGFKAEGLGTLGTLGLIQECVLKLCEILLKRSFLLCAIVDRGMTVVLPSQKAFLTRDSHGTEAAKPKQHKYEQRTRA